MHIQYSHYLSGHSGVKVVQSYPSWTLACQAPLSMRFPKQQYWSGLSFPSPGDLPDPGIKPRSPVWQADSSLVWATGRQCAGEWRKNDLFRDQHSCLRRVFFLTLPTPYRFWSEQKSERVSTFACYMLFIKGTATTYVFMMAGLAFVERQSTCQGALLRGTPQLCQLKKVPRGLSHWPL